MGNGQRFAERYGGEVLWCFQWGKWLVFDRGRWETDESGMLTMGLAKDVALDIHLEVRNAATKAERASRSRHAFYSESVRGLKNMLEAAKSEPGMSVHTDWLDRDPWMLNVANGTIDLRTGELKPHDATDLITKACPVRRLRLCSRRWL
jgi:putative DNA primase/helicase